MKNNFPAFAFIPVVRASQRPKEALAELARLGLNDVSLENRLEVRNENGQHEIVLIGAVGKSWWDDSGITEKEFRDALKTIPKGSRINVLVNSEGGSVQEGLGIYNAIKERSAEITCRITGYAVSIASVFPLAAHKVISPKSAIWMTHRAWSFTQGNDEDHDKAAAMLREHNSTLVDIYASETGKSVAEWEAWMKAETWIRGSKAIEYGLADEADEADAQASYRPLHPDFIQRCKSLSPEILNAISALPPQGERKHEPTTENQMRKENIALLNKWGIPVKDEATVTDVRLEELVTMGKTAAIVAFNGTAPKGETSTGNSITQKDVDNAVRTAVEAAEARANKRADIKAELEKLVADRRITEAQAKKYLPLALKEDGDGILAALRENPVMPEASAPLNAEAEISAEASPKEVVLAIGNFDRSMKAWQKGQGAVTMETLRDDSLARAHFIEKNAKRINLVLNTNTIPAGLQRSVILQQVIRDFPRRLAPLNMFSTKYENVPLEGNNKVQVPFYDLDTVATKSFKFTDGYVTGDTTTAVREIQVGKRADADVLDDTKTYDRKYIGINVSSEEMARQPYLKTLELVQQKADNLLQAIINHILGVVTAANYGAAAITKAAALFDSDDLSDLKVACKLWPAAGRGLLLDSAYDGALLKDVSFKHALNAASDSAIKEGRLFPRVFGFDYAEYPTIPANAENLVGFAVFKSAILVAFAPVPPIEEVRNAGTTYQIITEPTTGIVLEYRTFGDGQMDTGSHIIESSYGFAKGNGNALKRIVSA